MLVLVVTAALCVVAIAMTAYAVFTAELGHEDETGFHSDSRARHECRKAKDGMPNERTPAQRVSASLGGAATPRAPAAV